MIKFGDSYYLLESEILVIESAISGRNDFPFSAKILLKNGQSLGIDFKSEKARDDEVRKIAESVAKYRDDKLDKVRDIVTQCRSILTTMDKRTLRIWRLIKKEEATKKKENEDERQL